MSSTVEQAVERMDQLTAIVVEATVAEMRAAVADAPVPVRAGARIGAAMLAQVGLAISAPGTASPAHP